MRRPQYGQKNQNFSCLAIVLTFGDRLIGRFVYGSGTSDTPIVWGVKVCR